ncbi:hypothetical protein KVV02_002563 [Mortierella alpina]|uniref:Rad4-domain-containing protein n=1 Tax=Mortierella alpina TaxID=64518 RepID=A0A9P7ZZ12_MORAP|nr:hypothetical protein KVV02_002563 [Mortierella alpina]
MGPHGQTCPVLNTSTKEKHYACKSHISPQSLSLVDDLNFCIHAHSTPLSRLAMAPRTKKNGSSNRDQDSGANTATPTPSSPRRKSARRAPTASLHSVASSSTSHLQQHSTADATNFPTPKVESDGDMSEDDDFQTSVDGAPSNTAVASTSRSRSRGGNTKKHSLEESSANNNNRKHIKTEQDVSASPLSVKIDTYDDMGSEVASFEYKTESEIGEDLESGDDDDIDWEEVSVPAPEREDGMDADEEPLEEDEEPSGPWQYNAVEIVFDKPLKEVKKKPGRGITKEERMIRVLVHQTHLLCLIANGRLRNTWINHPKFSSVALSLVPSHIAESIQTTHSNAIREVNALQVLALWWRDSFVVTGPGIQHREYMDIDLVGVEAAIPVSNEECLKKRKNLQRKLLNRSGSSDVCAQLFSGICRALGLKTRLIESLQACSFKCTLPKEEASAEVDTEAESSTAKPSKAKGKGKRKKEVELDDDDTTRGSRVVIPTPHRQNKRPGPLKVPASHKQADPPVFWTEVYSTLSQKWVTIDPVRGFVNSPLKMHPPNSCSSNTLAYVVAFDEDNYVTDVTRRYTSQWGGATKKLRVQPAGQGGFNWWAHTIAGLMNPLPSSEEDLEEAELLQAEVSERMPTKLADFNNHPIYALERHLKKTEVLHPRIPVLGHIRGEAIYPRSCVKHVRSKENWLKRARTVKSDEVTPVKWVKSRPATIHQMRLKQQAKLSGEGSIDKGSLNNDDSQDVEQDTQSENTSDAGDGDLIALFGEWQTEPYQPPWVVDGKVPRNLYGRQDVFTPAMVPIGGTHLKGRNIGRVARQLGVDYVEAVTGFEFQSRRSVPVVQGIIVPTECAELVMDAYHEIAHHADQEALKRKKGEVLRRWRKLIRGVMMRSRLLEEYGEDNDKDSWVPEDNESDTETHKDAGNESGREKGCDGERSANGNGRGIPPHGQDEAVEKDNEVDAGGGFMMD